MEGEGSGGAPEMPREPGWYPDPFSATGRGERYFDGKGWGSADRPRGRHSTSPAVVTPRASAPVARVAPRRRRRFRVSPAVIGVVVIVGLGVGVTFLQRGSRSGASNGDAETRASAIAPPPAVDEATHPLGAPAPPPAGQGGYEFLRHQPDDPDTPVAFDPCRPVHYVVNRDGAPPDADQLMAQAVARVSQATGLRFVADGPTDERPDKERAAYQPGSYSAARWAPVLVAWSDAEDFPGLAGYVAGIGAPVAAATPSGRLAYVSGSVVLDRDALSTDALPDRGVAEAIVLHELGHLVGLDHTADSDELMYSEAQRTVRDFGPGDLRGLAVLGKQACVPEL